MSDFCLKSDLGDPECLTQCADCYALDAAPHWARRPAEGATLLHLVADDTEPYALCQASAPGPFPEPWQPASSGLPKCPHCQRLAS